MRKKILSPKIYPVSLSLSQEWFVQYWTKGDKPKRQKIRVPSLITLDARMAAAKDIISQIDHGKRDIKREIVEGHNDQLKFLFELVETKKPTYRKKTYFSYRSAIRNLDTYCRENKIRQITNAVAVEFLDISHNLCQ